MIELYLFIDEPAEVQGTLGNVDWRSFFSRLYRVGEKAKEELPVAVGQLDWPCAEIRQVISF